MAALEEEEREMSGDLSETIKKSYSSKAVWFFHALDSTNAMYQLFELQLRPQFISQRHPREDRCVLCRPLGPASKGDHGCENCGKGKNTTPNSGQCSGSRRAVEVRQVSQASRAISSSLPADMCRPKRSASPNPHPRVFDTNRDGNASGDETTADFQVPTCGRVWESKARSRY